jgi:hypothetical protein
MSEKTKHILKYSTITISAILILWIVCWVVGGINLSYLKEHGIEKALEICDGGTKIIYSGYERTLLGGFGGKVYYMCDINETPSEITVTRRINNKELQIYGPRQLFTLPTNFEIN